MAFEEAKKMIADAIKGHRKLSDFAPHYVSVPGENNAINAIEVGRYLDPINDNYLGDYVEKELKKSIENGHRFESNSILKDIQNHYNFTSK